MNPFIPRAAPVLARMQCLKTVSQRWLPMALNVP
jgi:hypothetical protein